MQYETHLGLRREHTFDEVRRYIQSDPDKIQFPKRDALFLEKSQLYGQVKAAMRNYAHDAQQGKALYEQSDDPAPYVPPRPQPPRDQGPPPPSDPSDPSGPSAPSDPPDVFMDEITGGPPPSPPGNGGYANFLRLSDGPRAGLAAEGVQLANLPPPPPPPPPPASGSVALALPGTAAAPPQEFIGPPAPLPSGPPATPGVRQAVSNFAHNAAHSFAGAAGNAAGQAVGTAAAGALLARMAGRGAQMGAEGGPAGVLGDAVAGVAVGGPGLAIQVFRIEAVPGGVHKRA